MYSNTLVVRLEARMRAVARQSVAVRVQESAQFRVGHIPSSSSSSSSSTHITVQVMLVPS
jgi:hypothetical protein